MKRKILLVLLITNISFFVFAENLTNVFFSEEIKQDVLTGEIVSRMYIKHNTVGENTDLFIAVPQTKYTPEDYSDYEMVCDERAFIPYDLDAKSKLSFYNKLLGFSQLKGADYWTFNGGKRVTFILDAFTLKSSKSREAVSDKIETELSPYQVNYYMQEDNKFGKLRFKSELYNDGNNFVTINSTLDPIFLITRAGEYKIISFFMYDEDLKGFFYYTVSVMKIRSDLVLKSGKLYPTTFSNRLRGGTVHLAKLLGVDFSDKIITWDWQKLMRGEYKNYK